MSAKLNTRGSHVFKKDKKSNRWYHAETHPIQAVCTESGRLFIQDGHVFANNDGEPLKAREIPQWFYDEVVKLPPAVLASCGYKLPESGGKIPKL
jgi:hypothetical protein